MPAAAARRPRAVGAPRRHHARALPPARQGPALRTASTRAWPPPTSSCATWNTACRWTTTGRPTRCPPTPARLELLARKMPADGTGDALRRRDAACGSLDEHLAAVREIYERVIHAQKPHVLHARAPSRAARRRKRSRAAAGQQPDALPGPARAAPGGGRGRAPACTAAASASSIFWKRRSPTRSCWSASTATRTLAAGVLDIFEHSPYFADELLRYPELLDEIGEPLPPGRRTARRRRRAAPLLPPPDAAHPEREHAAGARPSSPRWARPRALADSVIAAAYRIALARSAAARRAPPTRRATR